MYRDGYNVNGYYNNKDNNNNNNSTSNNSYNDICVHASCAVQYTASLRPSRSSRLYTYAYIYIYIYIHMYV